MFVNSYHLPDIKGGEKYQRASFYPYKNMKFSKTTLVVLITLTASISSANNNTFNGCVEAELGRCYQCFKRHSLPNGAGCGPLQPDDDPCLIYVYNSISKTQTCVGCKTGYADHDKFNGTTFIQTCVKGIIKGCFLELHLGTGKEKTISCLACPNNTYSVANPGTKIQSCQKISNPVANCMWGARGHPKSQ